MPSLTGKKFRLSPAIETRSLPDGTWLLKQTARLEYLALNPAQQAILQTFDGVRTVEEVLHTLLKQGAGANIRAFYDLVLAALAKGFLIESGADASAAPAVPEPVLAASTAALGRLIFSSLLILAGGLALSGSELSPGAELADWFKVLVLLSLGLTLAGALAGVALTHFGRQVYGLRIRWDRLVPFLSLDTRDAFMGGRFCEIAVALNALSGPFLLAALSWLVGSEAGLLASAIAALVVGSPFGNTAAHSLLHACFRKEYELPKCADQFLNTKLIAQLFQWKERLVEEKYFLLHSTYAICWFGLAFGLADNLIHHYGAPLVETFKRKHVDTSQSLPATICAVLAITLIGILLYVAWVLAQGVYRLLAPRFFSAETKAMQARADEHRPDESELVAFLGGTLLCAELAPDDLKNLAHAMQFIIVEPGATVIRERDSGDALFLVYAGRVEVVKEDESGTARRVANLARGDVFGEIALLDKVPRTSTVRSLEKTSLLVLSKADFDRLLVSSLGSARIKTIVQVCAFLRRHPLFANWHPQVLLKLSQEFVLEDCRPGQTVIQEGQPNESFYLVYEGQFHVRKQGATLATLQAGDFCGEISLLRDIPATAEVVAAQPGRCLRLSKANFLRLVSHDFLTGLVIEQAQQNRLTEGGKT